MGFYQRKATNLCTNGGFESGITGWATSNGVLSRVTNTSKYGAASGKFVTGATDVTHQAFNSPAATVVNGDPYTVSAWVWTDAAGITAGATCTISAFDTIATVVSDLITLTATPQRVTVTQTAASTIGQIFIKSTVESVNIFIDGVQIEPGSAATAYIETDGAVKTRPARGGHFYAPRLGR